MRRGTLLGGMSMSTRLSRYAESLVFPRLNSVASSCQIFPVNPDLLGTHAKFDVVSSSNAKTGAIPSRLAILGNVVPWRRNFQAVITHLHIAIKGELKMTHLHAYSQTWDLGTAHTRQSISVGLHVRRL